MALQIDPEPTEEEAAAIVAALEVGLPRAGAESAPDSVSRWRWSGRWWSKPVPIRRGRPG
ncbi:hypothetical protein [Dermatobacter hominis]|uniref:hypothetical protein n=1 Tax=Dermatobacter hominis TaxID=2884263 RepID=UPI001D103722|nr:hypothetical protein [Dermatobacter hominis]UDY34141.1 hypothetical protein LH044_12390 [Dermatobacter hominis]